MNDLTERQLKLIGELIPNFTIKTHRVINRGVNSIAAVINDDYIFRFPLRESSLSDYYTEKKILDIIRPHIKSTQIPKIEICKKYSDAFAYHKIIRGSEYINVSDPNNTLKKNLAKDLAKFCQELHSINTKSIDFISTDQFDISQYSLTGKNSYLEEILGNEYQGDLEKIVDYMNSYTNFDPGDNVLCHGDLHEENIIVKNNRLSGVIDFGTAVNRKRDVDFAHLLEYDYQLAFMVIDEYEGLTNREIDRKYIYNLQKVRCYGLLIWFVEQNDKKYTALFRKFIENLNRIEF